jgi:hypothetical protein
MGWLAGFAIAFSLLMLLTVSIAWLVTKGVGIWGINYPGRLGLCDCELSSGGSVSATPER